MFRITMIAALSIFPLASSLAAAAELGVFGPVLTPQQWNEGLTIADLQPHRMSDEFYSERWNFVFQSSDGANIFTSFAISNAGLGDFNGAVETTILPSSGTVVFEKTTGEDVEYDKEVFSIAVGKSSLRGNDKTFVLKISQKSIQIDLTIVMRAPGYKLGRACFNEKCSQKLEQSVFIPNGRATGTLKYGDTTVPVDTTVYADHGWGNAAPQKTADRLFALRGFGGDKVLSLLVYVTPDDLKHSLIGFVGIAEGDRNRAVVNRVNATESDFVADPDKQSYMVPRGIDLRNRDGQAGLSVRLGLDKPVHRQDATSDFNFVERGLIKMFVADPILYRYDTSFQVKYSNGETESTFDGRGVAEYMILNAN